MYDQESQSSQNSQVFPSLNQFEHEFSRSSHPYQKEKTITKEKQGRGRPRKFRKINVHQIKQPQEEEKNMLLFGFNEGSNQDLLQDIIENIHFNMIDFCSEINQDKGFVYGPQCRKKLSKLKKVRWSQKHIWSPQREKSKIQKICKLFQVKDNELLKMVLLEASSLFAEEFTGQFYIIMLQIYSIISEIRHQNEQSSQNEKSKLIKLATDIFSNKKDQYYFFSLTFRAEVKASKKMPFSRPTSPSAYIQLVTKIGQQLKRLNEQ